MAEYSSVSRSGHIKFAMCLICNVETVYNALQSQSSCDANICIPTTLLNTFPLQSCMLCSCWHQPCMHFNQARLF